MLYLSYQNWQSRIKTIKHEALKKYGRCKTTAIEMLMNKCIVETQPDKKTVVIDENHYKINRRIAVSKKFNVDGGNDNE